MNDDAPAGSGENPAWREVERFLANPATHGGRAVERIETHGAIIFLAGEAAYKIKKPVRYAFLDFSTLDKRRAVCERELVRGQAIAPAIYRRVLAITREPDGGLALAGSGTPAEWCVEMRRFAQEAILAAHAAAHGIGDDMARDLGHMVAAMHGAAERRESGAAAAGTVINGSIAPTLGGQAETFGEARVDALLGAMRAALERLAPGLDERGRAGMVRLCHGDLHLANIVLIGGAPTPFDAIEFDDRLAITDVFYDLAFLLMDLWQRGLRRAANVVLGRYLEATGDLAGLTALPLFLSMRAAIRAMVSALRGDIEGGRGYFAWAERFIDPPPARLVAIGGLSGTGKSTLARTLAPEIGPPPGAVLLRSDVERKLMLGAPETEPLGPEAYTKHASDLVYRRLRDRASAILRAGHGAMVDAVHAGEDERAAVESVAREAGIGFKGLWLEAPETVLLARVGARSGDASDADESVVAQQLGYELGSITWSRIDVSGTQGEVADRARGALGLEPGQSGT